MDVMKKVPVREQEPAVRAKNFEEVCLGYNTGEAVEEASREPWWPTSSTSMSGSSLLCASTASLALFMSPVISRSKSPAVQRMVRPSSLEPPRPMGAKTCKSAPPRGKEVSSVT